MPDPNRPEPARPDPNRPDPSQPDSNEPGPSQPDPTQPDPNRPDSNEPGPSQPGPNELGPSQPGPNETDPNKSGPSETEPSRPEPNRLGSYGFDEVTTRLSALPQPQPQVGPEVQVRPEVPPAGDELTVERPNPVADVFSGADGPTRPIRTIRPAELDAQPTVPQPTAQQPTVPQPTYLQPNESLLGGSLSTGLPPYGLEMGVPGSDDNPAGPGETAPSESAPSESGPHEPGHDEAGHNEARHDEAGHNAAGLSESAPSGSGPTEAGLGGSRERVTERGDAGDPDAVGALPGRVPEKESEPQSVPAAPWRRLSSAGALILVLLALFGFTLVVQLRSNDGDQGLATARQEDLVRILSDLEARDSRLQTEIAALEASQRQLTSGVSSRQAALDEATKRADELGLLAGTLPGRGAGLKIVVDKVKASAILNAVQELRGSGGEVMEIAGSAGGTVRIVASSYFVDAEGGGIIVDGVRLTGPFTLWVIGPPQTMQPALQIPGGVVASVNSGGGSVTIEAQDVVEVAAVRKATTLQYARPVS